MSAKISTFDRPVTTYPFDNKWMVYSPYEWQQVTDCLDHVYNDSLNANITIPAKVSTIDVEHECEAGGVFFLPAKSRSGKDFVDNTRFWLLLWPSDRIKSSFPY